MKDDSRRILNLNTLSGDVKITLTNFNGDYTVKTLTGTVKVLGKGVQASKGTTEGNRMERYSGTAGETDADNLDSVLVETESGDVELTFQYKDSR